MTNSLMSKINNIKRSKERNREHDPTVRYTFRGYRFAIPTEALRGESLNMKLAFIQAGEKHAREIWKRNEQG